MPEIHTTGTITTAPGQRLKEELDNFIDLGLTEGTPEWTHPFIILGGNKRNFFFTYGKN